MFKKITHEEWIKALEQLHFEETGILANEYNQIFENWLRDASVEKLLKLIKKLENK